MLSLKQALQKRGGAGLPLPVVYSKLHDAGCDFCRSQLSLIVGPPTSGKSAFAFNLIARWRVPTLAFLLDTNELTATCRFLSIITGDDYKTIKAAIEAGNADSYDYALSEVAHVRVIFEAYDPESIELEVKAYEQRYGLPPDVILIDNLGNMASAFENEWAMLKSLTLELDRLSRKTQAAILACAHTTDLISAEPLRRTAILGKVSQYPRVILSIGFNAYSHEFKVAIVKNTEGPSDPGAEHPLTFYADMARMRIEQDQWWPVPVPVYAGNSIKDFYKTD